MPARIRVIAALSMINDVARTPHVRAVPGIDDILDAAAAALLMAAGHQAEAISNESAIR